MNESDIKILTELAKLAKMFSSDSEEPVAKEAGRTHPYINLWVIVRHATSGVHFGMLEFYDNGDVILTQSRRLWEWKAKKGFTLSAVANYGIAPEDSKLSCPAEIFLHNVAEIIPVPLAAQTSLIDAVSHNE